MKGFKVKDGFFSKQGFFSFQGFKSGKGFNFTDDPTPPVFNGTYWYSPLINNGNDTITNGSFINEGLSIKNVELTTGIQTIPAQTLAVFPNHSVYGNSISGALGEPEATTQIPSDMSIWQTIVNSTVTYNPTTKESRWLFTGGNVNHRVFQNSPVTSGLDYVFSAEFKKPAVGESQFVQITGSTGFDLFVVNYDLLNGLFNEQTPASNLKDSGIVDAGDYFKVYVTVEATSSTNGGRLILAKANSLADARLPTSLDSGAFTVRYPNFVQASYASSPIDAPLAATTRAKDVISCPTSAALVDANHGLTESGGIINLAGTKFDGLLDNKVVGACFVEGVTIKATVTSYNANTLTVDGDIQGAFLTLHTGSYTVAEAEQLRLDAGDTPPIKKPDDSFFWATWAGESVTFEAEFTLYNDDTTVVFSMEWENEAEETYSERIGDNLKFRHGTDELTVPYASLLEIGVTYKAKVSITPTQLIGEINGVEVGNVTRADTRLAVWKNICYQGNYDGSINSCIVSQFKVSDYVEIPPPLGLVVEADIIAPDVVGYADIAGVVSGSLVPPITINGQTLTLLYSVFGGGQYAVTTESVLDNTDQDLTITYAGLTFVLEWDGSSHNLTGAVAEQVYNLFQANVGQAVTDFTVETAASDFADNGDFANNGDFA